MAASKVKPLEKPNDKHADTLVSNGGFTSQEKSQSNSQSSEMRMTLRCSKELIDRLDKMRQEKAGRISRNQAIVEILDAKLSR